MDDEIRVEFLAGTKILLRGAVGREDVLEALRTPGELLKSSRKSTTRRVGPWVIKQSRSEAGLGWIKRTFLRERYRRAWTAANRMLGQGILVPPPVAFVEYGYGGVITNNVYVSEYMAGYCNVEKWAAAMVKEAATDERIARFLFRLAEAVNHLAAAGVYHPDLSGKNIFTRDGESFCFIDLDAVQLDTPNDDELRKESHVQLYDSFCDLFEPDLLVSFVARMLPAGHDIRAWLIDVRNRQRARRDHHEAQRLRKRN